MATRRYKINPHEKQVNGAVTEEVGAATNSKCIELTVDLATSYNTNGAGTAVAVSKMEVIDALEELIDYISARQWPPA